VPQTDADAVARLREAGAIIIGKLNLHEFAYGVTNAASHFGPTRNPWDIGRIPGGSSGGSAAAVAAAECFGALGTDTAASIRLPAALGGIVGLKPTYDLVSRKGVIPLAWSLDHCGPMARTVTDTALILNVLADKGVDYAESIEQGVRGLRIGVPRHYFHENTQTEVIESFERAMRTLSDHGASVIDIEMPSLAYVSPALAAIMTTEATNYHLPLLRKHADDYTDIIRLRLKRGVLYTAAHYLQAQRTRTVVIEDMRRIFEDVDLLAIPTSPFTALELSDRSDILPETRLLNWHTRPFNLTGHPAISVPCGFDDSGLPIGLQLVSRPFEEATLLRAAYAYEKDSGWYGRRPPI
jgi:aspartyl-tRNA(Asn)/glutamyl-tRNA(Gln) amidotransferase subunit A